MTSILSTGQHGDKLFWFSLGVFIVAASHITYRQLETFKKRCEIKPSRQKDTVDKSTENAIKLETLAVLARGINYNLSRAALRIIAGRALSSDTFPILLNNLKNYHVPTRLQAVKTFRFLIYSKPKSDKFYENDSDYVLSKENEQKLCSTEACKAVITAITRSIIKPNQEHLSDDNIAHNCLRYGIECLHRIVHLNPRAAIEAGVKNFLMEYPIEGYPSIEAAIQDKEYQPDNYHLIEIYGTISHMDAAVSQLRNVQTMREEGRAPIEVMEDGANIHADSIRSAARREVFRSRDGQVELEVELLVD